MGSPTDTRTMQDQELELGRQELYFRITGNDKIAKDGQEILEVQEVAQEALRNKVFRDTEGVQHKLVLDDDLRELGRERMKRFMQEAVD